ncbi:efflux RND transporter periplasmic adaptor subunit [Methylocapsa polymorpha]|uniref:Efflux RND transporter periplasmic adaptor subunit n=1 Tax=Methylocapsa polymorpha TaxID=3080828 RepID=A0ABZ0HUB6_9HYPH|nr:efflux RND transporter periplasmic adaptor subunit [Methylocapsa sp. RX1]
MTPMEKPEQDSSEFGDGAARPGVGRKLSFLAAAVALSLAGAFLFVRHERAISAARLAQMNSQDAMEVPRVDVVTVVATPTTQPLVLPGETASWYETTIYARVNGYVAKWLVDIGDHVANGQLLATIDTPELDAELVAAKAKLNVSEAQVAVKQARAEFARTTYQRWRDSPKGVVSDQERESTKASSAEAVAELKAAQAQVMLNQADVDRLSALTQFKDVRAPFDGAIVQRRIDLGDLVTAGSSTTTSSLYRISQDNQMRVFVHAPQRTAAQLMQLDSPATITANDQPTLRFEGKVTRTARAINPEARTLRVEIDIPNSDHALVPGMYVQVSFRLTNNGLIQAPAAALLFRSNGPQIAVVDDEGMITFKDVTIVRDDGPVVDIGSGLTVGDKVALNLNNQIVSGQKVQINEIDKGRAHVSAAQ